MWPEHGEEIAVMEEELNRVMPEYLSKIYDFYEGFEGDRAPRVLIDEDELHTKFKYKLPLLRTLGSQMKKKSVPRQFKKGLGDLTFDWSIVSEDVLSRPHYKLQIDVVKRHEGGHHC